MAFQHCLSTNNYGPARIIVAPSAANGTHTTIASALADAVSGDTIFIRDGTYTEDLTLKAGVNISAFANGVYGRNATGIPTVEIIGELTATFAGTCSICNVRLITNGAPFLTVSGSSATIALLNTCELICADNTGIVNSSSSSGSNFYAIHCYGNILTTGIAIFSMSSAGRMFFRECHFNNSGSSSTTNLMSGGITTMRYCHFNSAFETSGTTAILQLQYTVLNTTAIDVPCLTHNSTSSNNSLQFTTFTSDNAIALVTGAGTSIDLLAPVFITAGGFAHTSIGGTANILGTENTATSFAADSSSATPTVAGALTIAGDNGLVTAGSGSTISVGTGSSLTVGSSNSGATNTVTISNSSNTASSNAGFVASVAGSSAGDPTYQATVSGVTTWTWGIDNNITSPTVDPWVLSQGTALGTNNVMSVATSGEINYPLQPAFMAILGATDANVTGDGTEFTIGSTTAMTERFDQGGDFNTNGTFTAPVTGKYNFAANIFFSSLGAGHTIAAVYIVPSSGIQYRTSINGATIRDANNNAGIYLNALINMTAGDTCTIRGVVTNSTKTVGVLGLAGIGLTYFCGNLVA